MWDATEAMLGLVGGKKGVGRWREEGWDWRGGGGWVPVIRTTVDGEDFSKRLLSSSRSFASSDRRQERLHKINEIRELNTATLRTSWVK